MFLGIMVLSINDSYGRGGFYNSQETGLAKALSGSVERIVIYRFTDDEKKESESVIEGHDNITFSIIASKRVGGNALPDVRKLDSSIDRLICFSDTQYGFPRIYRWCRKNNIDIYPYIGVVKSHSTSPLKRFISDLLFTRNLNIYKKCLCLAKTPAVLKELEDMGVSEVRLLPVGLDEELLNPRYKETAREKLLEEFGYGRDERIVLFIGRLIDEKEPLRLIRIFAGVFQRDDSFRLFMVGNGPLREDVEKAIGEYGLGSAVRMIERIPNNEIWKLYRMAEVFINLNRQEIFGMAVLEALYYDCRVVAWSAPGPDHILRETGVICNSDGEVIEALLCHGDADTHDYIQENFVWGRIAKRLDDLLCTT